MCIYIYIYICESKAIKQIKNETDRRSKHIKKQTDRRNKHIKNHEFKHI